MSVRLLNELLHGNKIIVFEILTRLLEIKYANN